MAELYRIGSQKRATPEDLKKDLQAQARAKDLPGPKDEVLRGPSPVEAITGFITNLVSGSPETKKTAAEIVAVMKEMNCSREEAELIVGFGQVDVDPEQLARLQKIDQEEGIFA